MGMVCVALPLFVNQVGTPAAHVIALGGGMLATAGTFSQMVREELLDVE